jgi:hypothetical protein
MNCPKCKHRIPDGEVVAANAAIVAKRRKRRGTQLTSSQARVNQARSVAARLANAARKAVPGSR